MPSKLEQISDAITAEVKKVAGIGTTGTDWTNWSQETRFPAAYTVLDSDEKDFSPTRSKEGRAQFRVATILSSDNPQKRFFELYAAVETEIDDDPSLGGLALSARVTGAGSFATSKTIAGQVYVRDILVTVEYRHDRAAP